MSATIIRWRSPFPNVYIFNGRSSIEHPITLGCCSRNRDNCVEVGLTIVATDVEFGLVVAVGGIRVCVGRGGISVGSSAIKRGKFGEVSVENIARLEIERLDVN